MESKPFKTINELFLQAMEDHQKPDAFLTKTEGRYRGVASRDVLLKVAALAQALQEMGVGVGDRVALLSENRLEWALTDYAILGLGAVTVPLYSTLLEGDVEFILEDSGSKGIVVSTRDQLKKVLAVRSSVPELKFVVAMDSEPGEFPGVLCWNELAGPKAGGGPDPVKLLEEQALRTQSGDIATIVYTSGTTGVFKGVVLTHANIASNIQACDVLFDFHPGDVSMAFLPLARAFRSCWSFPQAGARGQACLFQNSFADGWAIAAADFRRGAAEPGTRGIFLLHRNSDLRRLRADGNIPRDCR
jgi:long-chain acyl-CoA synthetase